MPDQLVYLPLTVGELRALNSWHSDGGVVGEEQERDLQAAREKLRVWSVIAVRS